jgi:hypothetical protein
MAICPRWSFGRDNLIGANLELDAMLGRDWEKLLWITPLLLRPLLVAPNLSFSPQKFG